MRDRAFATTSSRVMGFADVPRTSRTQSFISVPSASVSSTIASRLGRRASIRGSATTSTLARCLQDGRIFHPLLVMSRSECRRFVQQHDRHHVLHADIRHVTIAHGVGFVSSDPHYHLLYVVGAKRPLFEEACKCVERSLDGRAHRPFLDVRLRDLVALAELFHELSGIGLYDTAIPGCS